MRLGFPLVGVTLPDPPPHFSVFASWLSAGRQASMNYLATQRSLERRSDLKKVLPEARSVLSVGLPYSNPIPLGPHPGYGRVAAYAWGSDYHDVIPGRLQALVAWLQALTGKTIAQRGYTDTGPILERDLAQRAGLGWIGKNTCLIHPRFGSFFLLGELFLDTELELDSPLEHDYCGSCRRCIEACPTQCILPDRTIDAGSCISYLTIENKGVIQGELRPKMGDWIFGCDICQQVCPWNIRFASLPPDPQLSKVEGIPQPKLTDELLLSPQDFNRKFSNSPLQRPHRRGYLRNVAVALGNLADPQTLPALRQALKEDPEPLVRSHVAWAIGQIGGKAARTALNQAIKVEPDEYVLGEIKTALEK